MHSFNKNNTHEALHRVLASLDLNAMPSTPPAFGQRRAKRGQSFLGGVGGGGEEGDRWSCVGDRPERVDACLADLLRPPPERGEAEAKAAAAHEGDLGREEEEWHC